MSDKKDDELDLSYTVIEESTETKGKPMAASVNPDWNPAEISTFNGYHAEPFDAELDRLRERLANATLVYNSIPVICTQARDIVMAEIVRTKESIRCVGFLKRRY